MDTLTSEYENKYKKFLVSINDTISRSWPMKISKVSIINGTEAFYGIIPLFIHVKVSPTSQPNKVSVVANLTTETYGTCPIQTEWIFEKTSFDLSNGKRVADILLQNLKLKFPNFARIKF